MLKKRRTYEILSIQTQDTQFQLVKINMKVEMSKSRVKQQNVSVIGLFSLAGRHEKIDDVFVYHECQSTSWSHSTKNKNKQTQSKTTFATCLLPCLFVFSYAFPVRFVYLFVFSCAFPIRFVYLFVFSCAFPIRFVHLFVFSCAFPIRFV